MQIVKTGDKNSPCPGVAGSGLLSGGARRTAAADAGRGMDVCSTDTCLWTKKTGLIKFPHYNGANVPFSTLILHRYSQRDCMKLRSTHSVTDLMYVQCDVRFLVNKQALVNLGQDGYM